MVTDLLRDDMGFDGIVVTDAMEMGAISSKYKSDEAAVMAIQAGVDMILMPEDFDLAYKGVLDAAKSGEISEERLNESLVRIIKVKQGIAGESN
jgi:beta-N-acetylhexosaminidase